MMTVTAMTPHPAPPSLQPARRRLATRAALVATAAAIISGCSTGAAPGPNTPTQSGASVTSAATDSATGGSSVTSGPATGAVGGRVPVKTLAYSFPAGAVEVNSGGGTMLSRLEGVLAVPDTPGRHPVAIILHGSYPNCIDAPREKVLASTINVVAWEALCGTKRILVESFTSGPEYVRWSASFAGMAQELASRGIAAVSIDVAVKTDNSFGEPDQDAVHSVLVERHRKILADLDAGKDLGLPSAPSLKGTLDLDRLALIGHSSAGGFVAGLQNATHGIPGVKALVPLEPAKNIADANAKAHPLPMLFIGGRCDEQATYDDVSQLARDAGKQSVGAPVLFATMEKTTHIAMIGGGDHTKGLVTPIETPACATSALAPAGAVRQQAAVLVADFLTTVFSGGNDFTFRIAGVPGASVAVIAGAAKVATTVVDEQGLGKDVLANSVTFVESSQQRLPAFTRTRP